MPSPGSGPGIPERPDDARRSSIFNAFSRRITGSRTKSPNPPPALSANVTSPGARRSILGFSFTDAIQSAPAGPGGDVVQPGDLTGSKAPSGGPQELDTLVSQLHASRPLPLRTAAVTKIVKILQEYPVKNVMGLWIQGHDLLSEEQPPETAEVGYKLLRSCVGVPDLEAIERSSFFAAACMRPHDKRLDLRLDIISTLTDGGRTLDACKSLVVPFILNTLEICFEQSREARSNASKSQNGKSVSQPGKEGENMAKLFRYTVDVCKFNSTVFADEDLETLLMKTMSICEQTTQHVDIANAIRLFDTIITYVHIPSRVLKPCLEVLCSIHRQVPELQEQTWNTLNNLFKSHVGQAAVSALLHTLMDGANRTTHQSSYYRGSIQVLQLILLEDGHNGLPKVPMSVLFHALRASLKENRESQEDFVIGLLAAVLAEENTRGLLLKEANFNDLLDVIRICAGRKEGKGSAGEVSASVGDTASALDMAASVTSNAGYPETETENDHTADATHIAQPQTGNLYRTSGDDITKVLQGLHALSGEMEHFQKAALMELLMQLPQRLDDATVEDVIKFYDEQRYFHPSNEDWLEACRCLVGGILNDTSRPRALRIWIVQMLSTKVYTIVESICPDDAALQCATLLLNNLETEQDVGVMHELVDFAVDVIDHASETGFSDTMNLLRRRLDLEKVEVPSAANNSHPPWISSATAAPVDDNLGTICNVIATAFVRLFIRCVGKSARKTRYLYEILRHIAGCDNYDSDARLTALKLLFRLRAESNHAITVSSSSEGESIASVLCRTADTASMSERADEGEEGSWREQRSGPTSSPNTSLNRQAARQTSLAGRVAKPIPPLWMYPGPKGLPEEPSPTPSRVVFSHIDAEKYPLSEDVLDMEVTLWLELVISLLQKAMDWEIYSYVLVHLGPQLSNQALVRSCVAQLRMLRSVICEQIRNSSFHEPPAHTLLKKDDVAVCLFHILTVLISYHDYYEKSEEDDVVKTFFHGLNSWDRTPIPCIHALTVCCQETPLSVSKSLDSIIQKMSMIITKPSTAIHILEFLTFVARMPELYKNFREAEFKRVFGVSLSYLSHVRSQQGSSAIAAPSQGGHRSLRHGGASRDFTSSPDRSGASKSRAAADDLPQYVYALAYHVITFWFIALRMEDRPKQIPWLTRNLFYTDSAGKQVMEEQGHVIIDMMNNLAYSDGGETIRDPSFAKPDDGEVWSKTWILGHSLVTIETASKTGVSLITIRRPCATRYMCTRPLLAPLPRHQVPFAIGQDSSNFHSSNDVTILPDDIFQTYYAPLNLADPPIPLPDDQMARRSIEMFDRNASVDCHKVGVIYIAEGQMGQACERAILANTIGSAAYTSFLDDLGTLMPLKGAQFNTGGLDRSDNMDGEYTYCWRDRVIELVFHIPTMMPNGDDSDMTYANKKRHIGNDFVNIIFNDSGLPYDFDTFPSQFNYVAIVISPESRASFVDRRLDNDPDGKNRYYKVQVMSQPGFPEISPAVEPKILCGKHLAAYCRLLAINASVFSQVWKVRDGGESISSWRNRLREIKRLRERYGATDQATLSSPSSPAQDAGHMTMSPPSRENNQSAQSFKRTSVATFSSSVTGQSHDAT
ncbi:hypothetical protein M011DRAFT_470341 [Sporormia fimetaria CBS 119925]|uniref:Rap-GAP domain-containing protein n=1 Tax=Sporormia fimetaria CBS 119925 TaxID=1340428 RepID=A0A6A6V1T2_9PLEO|nr:hypothetical protein M011DRAFT_470341 [Sporormia fimetaria CBS 119925]